MALKLSVAQNGIQTIHLETKGTNFEAVFAEAIYDVTDKEFILFGLLDSFSESLEKDGVPVKLVSNNPVKIAMPLQDEEKSFKDKATGTERKYTVKSLPEYQWLIALLKEQGIESKQPFSGSISTKISDSFWNAFTGDLKWKGKQKDKEFFIDLCRNTYVDVTPLEKLSFAVPDLTTTPKTYSRSSQTEKERLNDRYEFVKALLVCDKDKLPTITNFYELVTATLEDFEADDYGKQSAFIAQLIMGK